jgi:hypothetical protein
MPLAADRRGGCRMQSLIAHEVLSRGFFIMAVRDGSGLATLVAKPIVALFRSAVAE